MHVGSVKSGDDLRRVVLDASLDLITHGGLKGFSMREVARRAGVSHQAPYHHFQDREAILAALVTEGFQRLRAGMADAIAVRAKPIDQLTAIGKAYVAFAQANPAHFQLMFGSEWVRSDQHRETQDCAGSAFNLLVEVVDRVAHEHYGRSDPKLVLGAWSLAHGVATLLVEGKLQVACGPAVSDQEKAAMAVIERFSELIARP